MTASIERVVSSPPLPASDTAEAAAVRLDLSVEIREGLREIDHGQWEGHTAGEIAHLWPGQLDLWHSCPEEVIMPRGRAFMTCPIVPGRISSRFWPDRETAWPFSLTTLSSRLSCVGSLGAP
jgi:hypothetical protein